MDFDKPKVYGDTFISGGLVFFIFLELPVVQAVLKSLHQVHIRKGLSAAGFIRLRSLLAVMCKSERKKKIVGTINHY